MIRHNATLCITLLLIFMACYSPAVKAAPAPFTSPTVMLLHEPVELQRYEVPSQSLPEWYAVREAHPALLLYSNDPLLQPTTPAVQDNLLKQIKMNNTSSLRLDIADPAILPGMTLSSALEAGLFSAVYWVMPSPGELEELSIEAFRSQMIQTGTASEAEAGGFTLKEGIFSGILGGVPFHALHPSAKISIRGPAVAHFDLSFFSPLFKSEIKTPIYPLIFDTLSHLRDQRVQTLFVSFSYSQVSGIMPLGSRFIGDVFVQILHRPEMLEQPIPNLWRERGNAFYLSEMIMARKAYDSLLKLAKTNTQDPSIHYALFSTSREVTALRPAALGHLAEAVQGDPVYAYEYLRLASLAREKGLNKEALNVLRLAHQALPDNPLVSLELARTLIVDGNTNDAVPLLEKLLTVQWSNIFYPGRRETLLRLRDAAGK